MILLFFAWGEAIVVVMEGVIDHNARKQGRQGEIMIYEIIMALVIAVMTP